MQDSINDFMLCENVHIRLIYIETEEDDTISRQAYCQVKKLANDKFGDGDWDIRKSVTGKPYFKNSNKHYLSISHTDNIVAIAVCMGKPIGIDIERIHKISDKVIKKYYSDAEKKRIFQCSEDSQNEEVKIWTLKEAHCKCTGTGLDKFSLRWNSINQTEMAVGNRQVENYIISVCKSK